MRRNGVHQHRRRVGRFAARHINTHTVQRRDLLAQHCAVLVTVAPALAAGFFLGFMKTAHTQRGGLQGRALLLRNSHERGFELILRQLEGGHGTDIQPIKALGVIQYRRIATLLHVGQNISDLLFYRGVSLG